MGGLSVENVCYGLVFISLIKSVMNTRTKNPLRGLFRKGFLFGLMSETYGQTVGV